MRRVAVFLIGLFIGLASLTIVEAQGGLSSQVLQLLARDNTWTGHQSFDPRGGIIVLDGLPSTVTNKIYQIGGTLYWNGLVVAAAPPGAAIPHLLLSGTHTDTVISGATRGDVIVGVAGALWDDLPIGAVGFMFRSNGIDPEWSSDGSGLTALNATQLTAGVVPLARLVNIANAQIDAAAAIAWTKINKAGSSIADLATRSAADLDAGLLPDARLSANVSLLGALIESVDITDATILFADWNQNGCILNQIPKWNGAVWACATDAAGGGSVTSVGLTMPGIFTVAGSPITTAGVIGVTAAGQAANLIWAGPPAGAPAVPTFRALVDDDILDTITIAGANNVTWASVNKATSNLTDLVTRLISDTTGILAVTRGGTGLAGVGGAGFFLRSTGANVWAAANIIDADVPDTVTINGVNTVSWASVNQAGSNLGIEQHYFRTASCTYANAPILDTAWSVDDAALPTAVCVDGANVDYGYLSYTDASAQTAWLETAIPVDWDVGAVDIKLLWHSPAVANDVYWQVSTVCVSPTAGETLDPAFAATTNIADTSMGVASQLNVATIVGHVLTGCAVGEWLVIRVHRDPANVNDTLTDIANLVGLELTWTRVM